jgi:hypothetical protein
MIERCKAPVRGGGECQLAPGHTGYHSTVTFICEGCGVPRRGQPYRRYIVMVGGEQDDVFEFCFFCVKHDEREADKYRSMEYDY